MVTPNATKPARNLRPFAMATGALALVAPAAAQNPPPNPNYTPALNAFRSDVITFIGDNMAAMFSVLFVVLSLYFALRFIKRAFH